MTLRQGYLLSLESFIDVINKKEKTQITKFTNGLECYDPLELRIEYFFLSNQINARGISLITGQMYICPIKYQWRKDLYFINRIYMSERCSIDIHPCVYLY